MVRAVKFVKGREGRNNDAGCELQESLPLFTENIYSGSMHVTSPELNLNVKNKYINQLDSCIEVDFDQKIEKRTSSLGRQDHLACAKRLSRVMRQIPTNSRQHVQAGRLVCHHLVAMLQNS